MSAVLFFLVGGCTESADDGGAPAPSADVVESRPGIVQVGDEDGPVLGESETCERFRAGAIRNRERLECDLPELLVCPQLIRPLASLACATYSEASLSSCLEAFDDADDCEQLIPGACVLTAVLYRLDPACVPDASTSHGETSQSPDDGGLHGPDGSITPPADGPDGGKPDGSTPDGTEPSETSVRDGGVQSVPDAATSTQASVDAASGAAAQTSAPAVADAGEPLAQTSASPTDGG